MGKTYGEWLVRWRYLILVATLVAVAAAAGGLRFIGFKTDYRVFFSDDNPQLQAFEQLQNTYTKSDNVLFVLAPRDGKVFSNETLASVEYLTDAAWQMPYSIRVDSLSNYQHTEADGDDLIVADLVPDSTRLDAAVLQRIHEIAVHEPLLVNRLISKNGTVTGINVTIQLPDQGSGKEVPEITAFARNLAEEIRISPAW
jgi:predicted RND superfamily exporter protein